MVRRVRAPQRATGRRQRSGEPKNKGRRTRAAVTNTARIGEIDSKGRRWGRCAVRGGGGNRANHVGCVAYGITMVIYIQNKNG